MNKKYKIQLAFFGLMLIIFGACEKEYLYSLPPKAAPKTASQTATLEAALVTVAPSTINAPFWKTANYLLINSKDVSKGILYRDGALNLTGTFDGLMAFNQGKSANLLLKAAYDADYLYVLAEWNDTTVNPSEHSYMFNGNYDPLKPAESAAGWTSQRNADKLSFAFDIDGATGVSGTFATVGCQASCHGTGNITTMTTTTGSVDIWNWSLATSNPLGYAHDLTANSSGIKTDIGGALMERNSDGTTDRSAPKYEWNGVDQTVTLPSGTSSLLDPTYYLLNKSIMPGDAHNGEAIYNLNCETCHGINGIGAENGAINGIGANKKSRAAYKKAMDDQGDMAGYWGVLNATQKDDIVTYLRGIAGAPGYYLTMPTVGTSSADITIVSNVIPTQITNATAKSTNKHSKYQVLFKRKLKTNNTDDVQFNLATKKEYVFGVAIMDNDGKNHIGSTKETLTFK